MFTTTSCFFFDVSNLQVTNPPIDPLREGLVMSLEVNIGKRGNILEAGPQNASQVSVFILQLLMIAAI
jgi:glutamate synthase (ferredoxin)